MKKIFFIKIIATYFLLLSSVVATQANYFEEGIKLYENNKFEESKIFFEREIVFNPEHEKSYLYLAKIFNENKNDEDQEINLNNVLLLNPQNDEAIYMLTLLKIKQSDYKKAKELINKFILICEAFCSKENEMQKKFMKLTPENAEVKN
jgi:tetratricopeptide (TPR) repeat protein